MSTNHHFLLITLDGGGNLPPVLGIARKLQKRGHRVTVLTEPCLENTIRDDGFGYIPFEAYFTRKDRNEILFNDWNANMLNNPVLDQIVIGPSAILVEETLRAIALCKADAILVDCLLPAASMAAEIKGLPSSILFHFPEYLPGRNRPPGLMGLLPGRNWVGRLRDRILNQIFHLMLDKYKGKINKIRQDYGLSLVKHTADIFHIPDFRIIQTIEEFDFPLDPLPPNVRYTGPVLDEPDWVGEEWERPWTSDDKRPLVVVSFSSTFQNQANCIQKVISALSRLEVEGLVTLGPAMEKISFSIPENVKVIASAPHNKIFPEANLIVTHGGHGTVMKALSHGLPLLVMPMGRDQVDNAAKVSFHNLGCSLSPKSGSDKIAKTAEVILADKSYRRNAIKMQKLIQENLEENRFILELEHLVEQSSRHRMQPNHS